MKHGKDRVELVKVTRQPVFIQCNHSATATWNRTDFNASCRPCQMPILKIAQQPLSFTGDVDRNRVILGRIERVHDICGGKDRDFVFRRSPAKQDGYTQFLRKMCQKGLQ